MQEKGKRQLKKEQKIKEENIQKFEEEVIKNKQISNEFKIKMKKATIRNIIIAVILIVYMIFLNIAFWNFETNLYISMLKISSCIIGISSIIFFEIGYKRDNEYIFLNGAEIFITGILSLAYIYAYSLFFNTYSKMLMSITIILLIYFVIKVVILNIKMHRKYLKEKNDIKNIV